MKNKKTVNVIQVNDIVNVQCYKLNGEMYRQYNGLKIVEQSTDYLILSAKKTKVIKEKGGKWVIRKPSFWFFPMSSSIFYNVIATQTRSNKFDYYINIASPFVFEDQTIKYVDYDLDVKVIEANALSIVDSVDFTKNSKEFQYSEELKNHLYDSLSKVVRLIIEKNDIFDRAKILKITSKYK